MLTARELSAAMLSMHPVSARRRRSKPPQLRPMQYPRATEMRYERELRALVDEMQAQTLQLVHRYLPTLLDQARVERGDGVVHREDQAAAESLHAIMQQLRAAFGSEVTDATLERLARDIWDEVNRKHVRQFDTRYGGVLPIQVIGAPWEGGQAAHFVADNVRLIKSMSFQTFDQVEGVLMGALRDGLRVEEVTKQLRERFDVSRSRAKLIAQDQVGKAQSQLTKLRFKDAGVVEEEWSSSLDERVRKSHRRAHGKRYPVSEGLMVDGVMTRPGMPVRCRCGSIPVIPGLDDDEANTDQRSMKEGA